MRESVPLQNCPDKNAKLDFELNAILISEAQDNESVMSGMTEQTIEEGEYLTDRSLVNEPGANKPPTNTNIDNILSGISTRS
mmetsp:Transcript_29212/g.26600  ORF Transcript_29212/g.26600 Transcript_29212/m.26600 type:complete len:82 (+) Transcript_29212:495-740(+)